jgi:hypothetical protein
METRGNWFLMKVLPWVFPSRGAGKVVEMGKNVPGLGKIAI